MTMENPEVKQKIDRTKVEKVVRVNGKEIQAQLDTGSDITILQMGAYKKLQLPRYTKINYEFEGVGTKNQTIGYVALDIEIDNQLFREIVYLIRNQETIPEMLIGLSLINQTELTMTSKGITIKKATQEKRTENPIQEVQQVKAKNESKKPIEDTLKMPNKSNEWNKLPFMIATINSKYDEYPEVKHIANAKIRNEVQHMIHSYKPQKVKESPIKLKLILTNETPIYQHARRLPIKQKEILEQQVKDWLKEGIIQPSSSDFAVPVVPVPKKNGSLRICVDYRPINKNLIKDRFPLPIIEDQIDALQEARIFTTIDLKNGYFHIPVEETSRKYTSFITSSGQYEFLRTPFGLSTCPAVFQRFINTIFSKLIYDGTILTYLDDIIIPSRTEEEGLEKFQTVLTIARDYGLEINWKKSSMMKRKIDFLGYNIQNGTIHVSESKTKDIQKYREPETQKQVQQFLRFTNYFRRFIENYAMIAKPLSDLIRKDSKFIFDNEQRQAFQKLKKLVMEHPILRLYKYGLETEVHTDASKFTLAAILFQRNPDDNQLHPIQYMSTKTSPTVNELIIYKKGAWRGRRENDTSLFQIDQLQKKGGEM